MQMLRREQRQPYLLVEKKSGASFQIAPRRSIELPDSPVATVPMYRFMRLLRQTDGSKSWTQGLQSLSPWHTASHCTLQMHSRDRQILRPVSVRKKNLSRELPWLCAAFKLHKS